MYGRNGVLTGLKILICRHDGECLANRNNMEKVLAGDNVSYTLEIRYPV